MFIKIKMYVCSHRAMLLNNFQQLKGLIQMLNLASPPAYAKEDVQELPTLLDTHIVSLALTTERPLQSPRVAGNQIHVVV